MNANNYLKLTIRTVVTLEHSQHTHTNEVGKFIRHEIVPVDTRVSGWEGPVRQALREMLDKITDTRSGRGKHVRVLCNISAHDPRPFQNLLPNGTAFTLERIGAIH